ncbi:MAG: hypothetical protein LC650_03365 [Actinobacteria bacterium]|nr:hypothetical protein [Actinomycetota bacterium]
MKQFRIEQGKIEVYSERLLNEAVRYIWGEVKEREEDEGEVTVYVKLGYSVAAWIEGAGCGWIEVPQWVKDLDGITLPIE